MSKPFNKKDKRNDNLINKVKKEYSNHLIKINPAPISENAYKSSSFYYQAELLPLMPNDKLKKIIDFGSGFGHLIRFLYENGYDNVGGVEIDEKLYKYSKEYLGNRASSLVNDDIFSFWQRSTTNLML